MKKILLIKISFLFCLFGCETEDDLRDTSFANKDFISESVDIEINISSDNSGLVIFNPYGNGVVSFEIDPGDKSPAVNILNGKLYEHYYETGVYRVKIISTSISGNKNSIEKEINVLKDCVVEDTQNIDSNEGNLNITILDRFKSIFIALGGYTSEPTENPSHDYINPTCRVEKVTRVEGCLPFAGILKFFPNSFEIKTGSDVLNLSLFSEEKSTSVELILIGSSTITLETNLDEINSWILKSFDLSGFHGETFNRMLIYFDKNQDCDNSSYYFDNITLN